MSHPPRRPGWRHSDGRPYDDFDFGAMRLEDDADVAEHVTRTEREPSSRRRSRVRMILGLVRGRPHEDRA